MEAREIFARIDHTLLKPCASRLEINRLCREAIDGGAATVCVPPSYVGRIHEAFPALKICAVVGFPLGFNTPAVKAFEALDAILDGAEEIDAVVNLGDVKNGDFAKITAEIAVLRQAVGEHILKIIVETCYLNEEEKIALCHCLAEGGADFIKTSTGFGPAGAALADVALFRKHLPHTVQIKASGGLKTREDFEAFLTAGCARLGASAGYRALFGDLQKEV